MTNTPYHYTSETANLETIKKVICRINISLDQLEDLIANILPLNHDDFLDTLSRLTTLATKLSNLPLPPSKGA